MPHLDRCSILWGSADVFDRDPNVTLVRDGLYMPYDHAGSWGLFDNDGVAVSAAIDFREGVHLPPDQRVTTPGKIGQVKTQAPHGAYIYGGRINPHFGHFLINTLPRFWSISQIRSPRTPILCHGPGRPAEWFAVPFISAAFGLLGLRERDFVTFDSPTRFKYVTVPGTSLEEQKAGYMAYRRMCLAMGERVRQRSTQDQSNQLIYFSKTKMKSAVGTIVNEVEVETVLRAAGAKIVFPELLSFEEQISLMSNHERISGTSGSFLHTSIFCPPRNITCLNVTSQINTNYTIIDKLSGSKSAYYYAPAIEVLPKQEGFLTARYLPDAALVAEELLDVAGR